MERDDQFTLELTGRQVTLIRVALMQRMSRLKTKPQSQSSYDDTRAMLDTGGVLSLDELAKANLPREVRKTARQREIEKLARNAGITSGL